MKRIENAPNRHLAFCTRRLALLEKARELSLLCDAEVALIGLSSSGSLFEYAGSRSMKEIVQAYFDTHAREPLACFTSHDSDSEVDIERLMEEVQRLAEKEERRGDMKELKLLSIEELEKLESELACELNSVRYRKDILIAEQRKTFLRKERELLRENHILREELKKAKCGVELEVEVSPCSSEHTMASADSRFCSKQIFYG